MGQLVHIKKKATPKKPKSVASPAAPIHTAGATTAKIGTKKKKKELAVENSHTENQIGIKKKKKKSLVAEGASVEEQISTAQALFDRACALIDQGAPTAQCQKALTSAVSVLRACVAATGSHADGPIQHTANNPAYLLANVLLEQGKISEDLGEYAEARAHYDAAVAAFPRSAGPRVHLSKMCRVCATSEADTQAAEEHLDHAVAIASEVLFLSQQGLYDPAFEVELAYGTQAQDALALLLAQEGRDKEARISMKARGYTWRLGRDVLHYPDPVTSVETVRELGADAILSASSSYVRAVDSILPAPMLAHMQAAFGKDSVFWREHHYGPNTPYFSYLHKLGTGSRDRSSLDQIIRFLHEKATKHFPGAKKAKYAEWWAHCRPHAHGHQLHFDSDDEGRSRAAGKPRHPIISSVCYLSDAHIGGPTLVTNQVLGANLADQGWVVAPNVNRYCMFEGSVLHGVVPGRGHVTEGVEARRVTFMVAFWEDIKATANPDGSPGSAQPFPYPDSDTWHLKKYDWPNALIPRTPDQWGVAHAPTPARVCPTPVANVWEPVRVAKKPRDSASAVLPKYEQCFQGF